MNCTNFVKMKLKNAERKIARKLKREQAQRALVDTLDAMMFGKSDITVRRLPPVKNTMAAIQMRDAILANAEMYDTNELAVVLLYLRGYSPRTVFTTLGVPCATGYRKYGRIIEQLREVCHE